MFSTGPAKLRIPAIVLGSMLMLLPAMSLGDTYHVPINYATIDEALNLALSGDTVLIACGSYREAELSINAGVTQRSETSRGAFKRLYCG